MVRKGVKSAEVVFRQTIQETGHFSSRRFREDNNLFGMKLPKIRPTTAIPGRNGYAKFASWKDAVRDYVYWQKAQELRGHDMNDYYTFLVASHYTEDPEYNSKLQRININRYLKA